jgi:FlaA1/EpsC-like NDP-sugar epimerase
MPFHAAAAGLLGGAKVLITGGTGNVGQALLRRILEHDPQVVRIFSRDEAKQFDMQQALGPRANVRFLLGDVRDLDRLRMAMQDVDLVFHAAGLKHVLACEYSPFEAVKTNVVGTQNLITAALEVEVDRVIFCSTDKAVSPANAMGASKLMAERLVTAANSHKGRRRTVFASTRFGNVIGTRGSAVPLFRRQIDGGGPVTLTDRDMTRYVLGLDEAADVVLQAALLARGGEVFVPKMPIVRISDLAEVMIDALQPGRPITLVETGLRPGEKRTEQLLTREEAERVVELEDLYVILPAIEPLAGVVEYRYPSLLRPRARTAGPPDVMLPPDAIRHLLRENALL